MNAKTIPTNWSVSDLVRDFNGGVIQIPEVQRDVVWKPDKVLRLLDSIGNDYPCASLILWEPKSKQAGVLCDWVRPEILETFRKTDPDYSPQYFLIDGQQRLTALAALAFGPGFLKQREPEAEYNWPTFYINLKRLSESMTAYSEADQPKFPWVASHELFDGSYDRPQKFGELPEETRRKIQEFRDRVRGYKFPVQIIQGFSYSTVGDIFARVNSEGTVLTGAEIHIAKIIPRWQGITKEFRSFLRKLRDDYHYNLDFTFLVRCLTTLATNGPRIGAFSDMVLGGKLSRSELDGLWRECKRGIERLLRILRTDALLDKSRYLTSRNTLVPLVYYMCKTPKGKIGKKYVLRYFFLAHLGEHYASGTENVLRKDLRSLYESESRLDGLKELCETVRCEARGERRLKGMALPRDEVSGTPARNPIVLLMYTALRRAGARDFGMTRPPSLDQIPTDGLDVHHIFPYKLLKDDKEFRSYVAENDLSTSDAHELINDIANLTFISKSQNTSIGDVSPLEYLDTRTSRDNLRAHFIPLNKELWSTRNYRDFLEERRRLLAKAINRQLKSLR